jgi:aminopeptidase N
MSRRLLIVATVLLLTACTPQAPPPPAPTAAFTPDPHSYARPNEARVTHVALDLSPDFGAKRLRGSARLTIERLAGAGAIVLDSRSLTIARVTDGNGAILAHQLGAEQPFLGQPLTITLGANTSTVAVEYETSPDAAAVQWLDPAQTAGGKLPFLFTQGQAILTRTWIPTQDSPGIRQTYEAIIRVPEGMRAVMSAALTSEPTIDHDGKLAFTFKLDQPIPPYLMALAVGDLAFKSIGERTGAYAEPSVVERAASEFAEVDRMMDAAERLYGPYRWGRYDILVLPPSFPYGGMENPRLTFATPTILAGDRSLVALVAHELAHSWSGNLVTNATWDDFWINEGFTTYLEARIMEELRGRRYADMLRQLGRQDLAQAIADAGGPQSPDTRLHLALAGRDPDEATGNVAYEKGSAFLQTVESVVGRERLDAFLREYFDRFAFQPMTSERLVAYMRERLFRPGEAERIDVHTWVFEPGLPANVPAVRAEAFAAVDRQIESWTKGQPASALQTADWSTHEWLHFLRGLPASIPQPRLAELDRAFRLSASGNSEILFAWLQMAIRNRHAPAFPALERFLLSQGRRKFVRPLYEELAKTDWGRTMALDIYRRARPTYHSVSVTSIDPILDWKERRPGA